MSETVRSWRKLTRTRRRAAAGKIAQRTKSSHSTPCLSEHAVVQIEQIEGVVAKKGHAGSSEFR
jgi:hypothetical protein